MCSVLNVGSLNIDHVYHVDHVARPGETLASASYEVFAGGKGANQSAALGSAGAQVYHCGRVGPEGRWLVLELEQFGVEVGHIVLDEETPGGHAIIQVDAHGENSIVLFPGCNHSISKVQINTVLEQFAPGDFLLLQNEISEIPYLIEEGFNKGMRVCFNPAPASSRMLDYPLQHVSMLFVNKSEGAILTGVEEEDAVLEQMVEGLRSRLPETELVITLGAEGAVFIPGEEQADPVVVEPVPVDGVVDSTGAGDTFIGYFIAALSRGDPTHDALEIAAAAAAISVTRAGAMSSIPTATETEALRRRHAGRHR